MLLSEILLSTISASTGVMYPCTSQEMNSLFCITVTSVSVDVALHTLQIKVFLHLVQFGGLVPKSE
jgi:hypothetical protein